MRKIFICEDDSSIRVEIQSIVQNYLLFHEDVFVSVCASEDPHEMMKMLKMEDNISGAVYFLDIDLHSDISGIDLAEYIRERDHLAHIIFITSHNEMALSIIKRRIRPLGLIEKSNLDQLQEEIFNHLKEVEKMDHILDEEVAFFSFKIGNRIQRICFDNLLYITTSTIPHRLQIVATNGFYEYYGRIKDVEQEYSGQLLSISRSTLVNPEVVQRIDYSNKELTLTNGKVLKFSQRKKRAIKDYYNLNHSDKTYM